MCKDKNKNSKDDTGFSKSYPATLFNLSDLDKKKVEEDVREILKNIFRE